MLDVQKNGMAKVRLWGGRVKSDLLSEVSDRHFPCVHDLTFVKCVDTHEGRELDACGWK